MGMRCCPIKTLTVHTLTNTLFLIMSKSVMLSLLAQGNTGSEILSILNSIVDDKDADIQGGYAALSSDEF